ncbi:porin family protein [Saccharicrinis sp. GN24d3]|uniref:porin family protein n=1 Tax=Saccharicrinis sp. GN24d3 TaxID=3458416 RepID=UPI004036B554
MFKLYTLLIICTILIPTGIFSQEKEKKKQKSTDIILIDDKDDRAVFGFPNARVEVNEHNDTVAKITIGRRRWEFIENYDDTKVRMVKVNRENFKGHWAGVQLGFCNYEETDQANFMDLNSGKSMTVGINFLQYNIGLQKTKTNFGLVTGMGWSVYNYRFDNNFLIMQNDEGITIGEPITDRKVKKSKIVTSYINIPLLLELQTSEESNVHAFVSAGVYGGFRLGSHTKTVYFGDDKKKSRQDMNINPLQYGVMFQVGVNFIKLYGTYNFSSLYESDKGPEVTPFTVGLTLANF